MILKNKLISTAALALSIGGFSMFTAAQETPKTDADNQPKREWRGKRDGLGKGYRGGKRDGMMRGFRDLNLTEAQKEQIRQIREANRPNQTLMEEFRALRQAKRDGSLTTEQQEKMKAFKEERREKGQAIQQQILAVLTPEQRQQLEVKKAEMKQKWEERKQLRQQRRQKPETENKDN